MITRVHSGRGHARLTARRIVGLICAPASDSLSAFRRNVLIRTVILVTKLLKSHTVFQANKIRIHVNHTCTLQSDNTWQWIKKSTALFTLDNRPHHLPGLGSSATFSLWILLTMFILLKPQYNATLNFHYIYGLVLSSVLAVYKSSLLVTLTNKISGNVRRLNSPRHRNINWIGFNC